MGSRECTSENAPRPDQGDPLAWVTALATALKNISIYPPDHPRVEGAAKDFVGPLAQAGSRHVWHVLSMRGERFRLGRQTVPTTSVPVSWLVRRFRDAGLRGVEFADDCSVADVLRFADVLNRSRARTGATFESQWQQGEARIRPLYLVFDGQHLEAETDEMEHAGSDGAGDADASMPGSVSGSGSAALHSPRLASLMKQVTSTPEVQERLRAIERCSAAIDDFDLREVDLLAAIAELLPADVSADANQVAEAVEEILVRVEIELGELLRRNAKVRGADLLRRALEVARKYFHSKAVDQKPQRDLPSGRPEDARIVADLDLLLGEVERLPEDTGLRLPPADQLQAQAPALAGELLGIYLHTLANHTNPNTDRALQAALRQVLTLSGANLVEVLDAYVRPKSGEPPLSRADRLRVIGMLVDAGLVALVRQQHYVDAETITRDFPESLPLAARILGDDAEGLAVLRAAFDALSPVLAIGGVQAAAKAGVLTDPRVIEVLVAIGGDVILPLLIEAAGNDSLLVRKTLLDYLRTLRLPPAEAAVCRAATDAALVPREYVQNLLTATTQKRLDTTLRTSSGQLLRRAIETAEGRLSPEATLVAIDDLVHVPTAETRALLRRLATAGRFTRFGAHARAVRRHARATLAACEAPNVP